MKEVGLTVGGFYKHFDSRDDLVAEALATMSTGWDAIVAAHSEDARSGPAFFDLLVDSYLERAHRDDPGGGCLFAALSSEIGRGGDKTRDVATARLERVLALLTRVYGDRSAPAARAAAITTYSALVGAVSLARATNDEKLSREILANVGKTLKKSLRPRPRRRRR
jgi:TetR/AcrR family transcriptional repressor of nem operon